ncbi:MAG: methyl-accepting chemotaxis protein [Lachnospiraceae bacterium]|nr:methyl-accepting chemotaxis protein [Lachnospiraceae bacterium]
MVKNTKDTTKVNLLQSIRTKIIGMVALGILLSVAISYFIVQTLVTQNFLDTMDHYLLDSTESYGNFITEIFSKDGEAALNDVNYKSVLNSVTIDNQTSSYIYIVNLEGIMLFHPESGKIGQPVENVVVKQLVADVKSGARPETAVYEYDYHGTVKYAAAYTDVDNGFISVISAEKSEVYAKVNNILNKTLLGGLVVFVICVSGTAVLAFVITKPIMQLSEVTGVLAGLDLRKDEKQEKVSKRKDEIGMMSKAIGHLRDKFEEVILEIKRQSSHLYSESNGLYENADRTATNIEQVEKAVHEIAEGANSQAAETQRATENVIRMGTMIEETGEQVDMLYENANMMKQSGEEASQTLVELEKINRKARTSIDVIYEQTNTTNVSAMKIREATNIITNIAEETNLLSLNASIEAARAGEQGRGFAVVASQIQKLAEQSNESARQIEDIINVLISDSNKAVETMDEVKTIMEEQSTNVAKTEEKFVQVKDGINSSIEGVNMIAEKTRLLDEARIVVVDVVQNLTAIAEENAASTEETSASMTEVSSVVYNITKSVGELQAIANELDNKMKEFII